MRRARRTLVAICTAAAIPALWAAVATAGPADLARYQDRELHKGAITLPVAAAMEYRYALASLRKGAREEAKQHLMSALELRPRYPDASFTLARIYARELNPEAVY
jgi:Tfp pilus assembly protein PilF